MRLFTRSLAHPDLSLVVHVSMAGAIAGGINAWLCHAGVPLPVAANPRFPWDIVPAGVLHGGILAFAGCLGALANGHTSWPRRVLTAAAIGWLAGYVSWQPLRLSLGGHLDWSPWPFDEGWGGALTYPMAHFGLVAAILAVFWTRDGMSPQRGLVAALSAGIAGSLWWWIAYEQWYLSWLHGSIWGLLVGWAARSGATATVMQRAQVSVEYL